MFWWVRDNPAPRARSRAQVAALATRGTAVIPMPDRVVNIQSKMENREKNLELLNHHRRKFDWDNEELDDDKNVK